MKPIKGYKVIEQTEDKLVIEDRWGETGGVTRVSGNPNPPPKEHQETINRVADILRAGEQRRLEREGVGA